jgi:hypothetical protein
MGQVRGRVVRGNSIIDTLCWRFMALVLRSRLEP